MHLTSYGKDVIFRMFIAGVILNVISLFIHISVVKYILAGVTVILWLFTLYFFRDPNRKLPGDYSDNKIVSPADGKVVMIKDVTNTEANLFGKDAELKQISIFLSPLNVHVNRIPLSGKVKYFRYVKGDYIVAFDHKSSERNERTEIGIEGSDGSGKKVLFKQIAGFVARRIVCDLSEGSVVKAGNRFGMIKFGSRVDILLERTAKVLVSENETVTGGETIIAEL